MSYLVAPFRVFQVVKYPVATMIVSYHIHNSICQVRKTEFRGETVESNSRPGSGSRGCWRWKIYEVSYLITIKPTNQQVYTLWIILGECCSVFSRLLESAVEHGVEIGDLVVENSFVDSEVFLFSANIEVYHLGTGDSINGELKMKYRRRLARDVYSRNAGSICFFSARGVSLAPTDIALAEALEGLSVAVTFV